MSKQTVKKTTTTDYLAPIHEIMGCVKDCYGKLEKLLETVPAKLQKTEASIKAKLSKAKEKQVKTKSALTDAKTKHKAKPVAANKQRVEKCEKALGEAKTQFETLTLELAPLTEQLKTCTTLKKDHAVIAKVIAKTKSDLQKQNTASLKKSAKKPKVKKKSVKAVKAKLKVASETSAKSSKQLKAA